jgi:hypothetical protein
MPSLRRAKLTARISQTLDAVRSAKNELARKTAMHALMRAEAELAALDRASAGTEFAYTLAPVPAH